MIDSRHESLDETVRRLKTYILRFERRYETPSAAMVKDVQSHKAKETAEIARWMNAYAQLLDLESRRGGRTTGTHTKII